MCGAIKKLAFCAFYLVTILFTLCCFCFIQEALSPKSWICLDCRGKTWKAPKKLEHVNLHLFFLQHVWLHNTVTHLTNNILSCTRMWVDRISVYNVHQRCNILSIPYCHLCFLSLYSDMFGGPTKRKTPSQMDAALCYKWMGGIRWDELWIIDEG